MCTILIMTRIELKHLLRDSHAHSESHMSISLRADSVMIESTLIIPTYRHHIISPKNNLDTRMIITTRLVTTTLIDLMMIEKVSEIISRQDNKITEAQIIEITTIETVGIHTTEVIRTMDLLENLNIEISLKMIKNTVEKVLKKSLRRTADKKRMWGLSSDKPQTHSILNGLAPPNLVLDAPLPAAKMTRLDPEMNVLFVMERSGL